MFPRVETHLPELMEFVHGLAADLQAGRVTSSDEVAEVVWGFFTPDRMGQVESVLPGWRAMALYAGGVTMVHTMLALAALLVLPEYEQASPDQQLLMPWIVLFHDLSKIVEPGVRDHTHGFRSSTLAARQLPRLGFAVRDGFEQEIDGWVALTLNAVTHDPRLGRLVHDNGQLPAIIAGIDRMFGLQTPAGLVVRTVLLHMSISNLIDWPQAASLTDAEVERTIDEALFPLLRMMMLVDNDAWEMFNPDAKPRYREETLDVFEHVRQIVFRDGEP